MLLDVLTYDPDRLLKENSVFFLERRAIMAID